MSFLKSGFALCAALVVAACAPMISPREAPTKLKDTFAESILVFAAGELCADLSVDEIAMEVVFEDVSVEMINAGYTVDQFDAMLVGLDVEDDWFIPYAIAFERKHSIDFENEAEFCGAMENERRARGRIRDMLL